MAWFAPGKNMPCDYVDMQTLMDVHYLIKKYQNQRIYIHISFCVHTPTFEYSFWFSASAAKGEETPAGTAGDQKEACNASG